MFRSWPCSTAADCACPTSRLPPRSKRMAPNGTSPDVSSRRPARAECLDLGLSGRRPHPPLGRAERRHCARYPLALRRPSVTTVGSTDCLWMELPGRSGSRVTMHGWWPNGAARAQAPADRSVGGRSGLPRPALATHEHTARLPACSAVVRIADAAEALDKCARSRRCGRCERSRVRSGHTCRTGCSVCARRPVHAFADAVSIRVAVHPRGFSACPVRLRSRSGSVSRN